MQATVGIAMGSGTEVARESANIMLIGNDLLRLVDTIRISRRCRRIIMQNFGGTLAVDSVGVGLAAFGFLNPLFAAFIHVVSELTFILNSARLLPRAYRKASEINRTVPKPHAQLLGTFDTSDPSGEFRAEQASVRGLAGESPYCGKSSVDRSRRELPILEEDSVTGNDNLVERQSWLRAVPLNKFINGVSVPTLRLG
jgi:hypothetical protein